MHGLLQVIYSLASGISPHLLALLASAGICGLILAGVGMVIAATAFVHRSLTAVRDRWTARRHQEAAWWDSAFPGDDATWFGSLDGLSRRARQSGADWVVQTVKEGP